MQAKRIAQVKFQLLQRRRNNNKSCGSLDGSSAPNGINLVNLGSKDNKQQELSKCESCSLNLCRRKAPGTKSAVFPCLEDPMRLRDPQGTMKKTKADTTTGIHSSFIVLGKMRQSRKDFQKQIPALKYWQV